MAKGQRFTEKDLKDKGFIEQDGVFKVGTLIEAPKKRAKRGIRTGGIDDCRNKTQQIDAFTRYIKEQLGIELWPEFYFSVEKMYRLDYAFPDAKFGIEVNGGIWARGKSGHSSGTGIKRDMDKANLLTCLGWRFISVTPSDLYKESTISMIKKILRDYHEKR